MATCLRSFCKINLGLAVGPVRADGFHGLATVYQTLSLHDLVTVHAVSASTTRIVLEANHPAVPRTRAGNAERNTAYRIVAMALDALHRSAEVTVTIEKRLPVQGGLGAGSANAAAALLGLERELGLALPGPARLQLAAQVGSDVPLFLLGGTVLGTNRGEAVFPLPDSPGLPVVVAVPRVGISTARAFADLDRAMAQQDALGNEASHLTVTGTSAKLEELCRVFSSVWATPGEKQVRSGIAITPSSSESSGGDLAENPLLALVRTGVENDFESAAFRQHPHLRDIKHALLGSSAGALEAAYASLSGSGSALFGVYTTPEAAHAAQQRVQALGSTALLTETLPRTGYFDRIFA